MLKHPEWYSHKTFYDIADVLCYTKVGGDPANWEIALPSELLCPTVKWYHQVIGHPESKRLNVQISKR